MFASCEKLSELEIKFIDSNNNVILDGGEITVEKGFCSTLKLQVDGKTTKQSIKVFMTILYEKGGGIYESEKEIATLFKNSNSTDVTFCDKEIGNYRARITLDPEGWSKTNPSKVCTFHIRITNNGEEPPDPKRFDCYVNGTLFPNNSTISITQNSKMKVKTQHSVPNGTKMHYKWDNGSYSSVDFNSNEAGIDLPHLQGTIRTLKVKVDDCPEQTFTIKSEGTPPPGGFECFVNGILYNHNSTIELTQNTSLIVKTIHSVPNNTLVYYQWGDETNYNTAIFLSNQASLELPYNPGTNRTLKIWINGYPEQRFHIKSEAISPRGFECYVDGYLANSTIHLYASTQNTYMTVKTIHSAPDYTLVYYKWNDEINYKTASLHSNQALIVLPYTPGTIKILDVWMNGYEKQVFLVQSH
ncbi:MAG: hypothetical protein LBI53_05975 [Candidatus Peribacteria bacterium]|nr:hypothetical protein [Candidatus Peribacteria bacterium]